ncbi:MAG: YggT family protein [Clostridia bacterium]|nr:YggT family protein [Clostridia bacterium]
MLDLISLALLVRALLSWFPEARQSRFYEIIYTVTEPILSPFRRLFDRLNIGRGFPIDLSFLAAVIVIQIICTVI